jgi:hypothetical protein
MLYVIFALVFMSMGLVTIICCIFSSMLSREEEHRTLLHDSPFYV